MSLVQDEPMRWYSRPRLSSEKRVGAKWRALGHRCALFVVAVVMAGAGSRLAARTTPRDRSELV